MGDMERSSRRWLVDAAVGGLFVAVGALAVFGPTSSAPAVGPTTSYTRITVTVSDKRLVVAPKTVPAGAAEISVSDERTNGSPALVVRSDLQPLDPGSNVLMLRGPGSHTLEARVGSRTLTAELHVLASTPATRN
jgi:hypothetical protein